MTFCKFIAFVLVFIQFSTFDLSRLSACLPPEPPVSGVRSFNGLKMLPDSVAVPFLVRASSNSSIAINESSVMLKGKEALGGFERIALDCDYENTYEVCKTILLWRSAETLEEGDYSLNFEVNVGEGFEMISSSFQVRQDNELPLLVTPDITLALVGHAGVEERLCCASELKKGDYCAPNDALSDAQRAIGIEHRCDDGLDGACQFCWPASYHYLPQLHATWSPSQQLVYYKVEMRSDVSNRMSYYYNTDINQKSHIFYGKEQAERYCAVVTAVSLITGETRTAERCIGRDAIALPDLPSSVDASQLSCVPVQDIAEEAEGSCSSAASGALGGAPLWLLGASWALRRRRARRV